ncbi:MAG: hypothetical protein ACSHXY_05475 [Alphaproteobacteria bacterium]
MVTFPIKIRLGISLLIAVIFAAKASAQLLPYKLDPFEVETEPHLLDSCTVIVNVPGVLKTSADHKTLSSDIFGGVSATVAVTNLSLSAQIQALPPTNFTTAPSGSDTDTTFSTNYSLLGTTIAFNTDGPTLTNLNIGASVMTVDAAATKSSGTFGAGNYVMVSTIRCVTP